MSSARLKRKINGLISKGLLDPDWRMKRVRVVPRRRARGGFLSGLWAEIAALITGLQSLKPEFRSQQVRKNDKKYWPTKPPQRVHARNQTRQHR